MWIKNKILDSKPWETSIYRTVGEKFFQLFIKIFDHVDIVIWFIRVSLLSSDWPNHVAQEKKRSLYFFTQEISFFIFPLFLPLFLKTIYKLFFGKKKNLRA